MKSVLSLMNVDLDVPDHTTLSRRRQRLDIQLDVSRSDMPIHLVIDSSGLSIITEGEWAAAKHGARGKRGRKKLHLVVDGSGVIVAQVLTDTAVDDAKTGLRLIEDTTGDIARKSLATIGRAVSRTRSFGTKESSATGCALVTPTRSKTRS